MRPEPSSGPLYRTKWGRNALLAKSLALGSWSIPRANPARSQQAEARPIALEAPFPTNIKDGFGGERKPAGLAFECLQG